MIFILIIAIIAVNASGSSQIALDTISDGGSSQTALNTINEVTVEETAEAVEEGTNPIDYNEK